MEVFSPLVGVTFRGAEAKEIVRGLTPNDGKLLSLEAEPDNEYDSHAVKVLYRAVHLGYIARENNYEIFQALREGKPLEIKIVSFENTLKPMLLIQERQPEQLEVPAHDPHPQED